MKTKYIQDFIDVDEVVLSMIKTGDGRYVKIAEVTPVNFELMDEGYQDDIIGRFASWLKICPDSFQIKAVTGRSDAGKYLKTFEEYQKSSDSEELMDLYKSFAKKVKEIGKGNAITRKYYIIFSHKPVIGEEEDVYQIERKLDGYINTAKNTFRDMGNAVMFPYPPESRRTFEERQSFYVEYYSGLFFCHFCRRTSKMITAEERQKRYIQDVYRLNRENPGIDKDMMAESISMVDPVSPHGTDFSIQPDCYISDGQYHTHLYIKSDGFPTKIYSAWIMPVFGAMEGAEIDIFFRKLDRMAFLSKLKYGSRFARARVGAADQRSESFSEIVSTYQAIEYFKSAMNGEYGNVQQDAFETAVLISVHADSYRSLMDKREFMMQQAVTKGFEVCDMKHMQHYGFKASVPLNSIPLRIFQKAKRNMATDGAASFYPFVGIELCDENGIFIGQHLYNRSLVVLDNFDTDRYPNANMCILGGSGSGKTFTLLLMAIRTRLQGNQNFLVTMEKPLEFKRACTALNGSYIKIGSGSDNCINILEIRPENMEIKKALYGIDDSYKSLVTEKVQDIITWFSLLLSDMTVEEEQLLDIAAVRMYEKFGIRKDDNSSIFIDGKKENGLRKMPVLSDLMEVLGEENDESCRRLKGLIRKFVEGSESSFNQQTNIDLDNKFTVFDIENIPDSLKGAVTYQVISAINSTMKEDPTKKQSVFIEEGWTFISSTANDKAAKVVQEMWKTIRGYGGSAIMSTQEMTDLTQSDYGRTVLSQSSIKIMLQMDETQASAVKSHLKLSDMEENMIKGGRNENPELREKGKGLLIANGIHIPVKVVASDEETMLISTDRRDLMKIREKR